MCSFQLPFACMSVCLWLICVCWIVCLIPCCFILLRYRPHKVYLSRGGWSPGSQGDINRGGGHEPTVSFSFYKTVKQ